MQYIIIGFTLTMAVAYAGYRIYLAVRRNGDPCYGCEGCALQEFKKQNRKKCTKNLQV